MFPVELLSPVAIRGYTCAPGRGIVDGWGRILLIPVKFLSPVAIRGHPSAPSGGIVDSWWQAWRAVVNFKSLQHPIRDLTWQTKRSRCYLETRRRGYSHRGHAGGGCHEDGAPHHWLPEPASRASGWTCCEFRCACEMRRLRELLRVSPFPAIDGRNRLVHPRQNDTQKPGETKRGGSWHMGHRNVEMLIH